MLSYLKTFARDERGQGLVEYALVIVLVALAAITGLTLFGSHAGSSLSNSANRLPS